MGLELGNEGIADAIIEIDLAADIEIAATVGDYAVNEVFTTVSAQ